MTQAEKTAIMQEYAIHEGDTGSPEAVSYTHLTLPTKA